MAVGNSCWFGVLTTLVGAAAASSSWLNVTLLTDGSPVVVNDVTAARWASPTAPGLLHQPCEQYWTDFNLGGSFTVNRSSTKASNTDGVATAGLFRYRDEPHRLGVRLSCHQTGFTLTNLSFFNNNTGSVVSVFWGKECVVYSMWYHLVDPANICMICLAVALVTWGGMRTENPVAQQIQQEMGEEAEISIKKAVSFVIGASISLVLIFYFLNLMTVLLTISFSFVSVVAVGMLVYSLLQPITIGERMQRQTWMIPHWGELTALELFSFLMGVGAVLFWILSDRYWVANNILGMSICLYMMAILRLPSIKVAAVLLTLLFCYDIFWVFYSEPIFGGNVMVTAAKGLDLPIKLVIPRGTTTPCSQSSSTMLGLGDIALPGLLGVFTRRFDRSQMSSHKIGYFHIFVVGYAAGLIVCFVVLFLFHAAQPALLYLVPGTLGSIVLTGLRRGELGALWTGLSSAGHEQEQLDVDNQEDHSAVVMHDEEVETAPMLNDLKRDQPSATSSSENSVELHSQSAGLKDNDSCIDSE